MEGSAFTPRQPPSPRRPDIRRWLGLGAIWLLGGLATVAAFIVLEAVAPAIGLPARIALAAMPLVAAPWTAAVIFPPIRPDARPEPRGLASLPPTGGGDPPRPGRAPVPRPERPASPAPAAITSPAALVTQLLRDAAARPASEAERRELAVRRQHDRAFAAAGKGLDETGCRALLAARRHPLLAGDLADAARRILAARLIQAPLPPDPRRDALHAAMLEKAPAVAAEFLEVMRVAPDLDPAAVAADLMGHAVDAAPKAPTDEQRLTEALEVFSRLGPVSASSNTDGSITLRPTPDLPRLPGV
jgi:hypothetical protein